MASISNKKWVRFDEEDECRNSSESRQTKPWPISRSEEQKSSETMCGSFSSVSSGNSFMSTIDFESRENSPTNIPGHKSKYLAFEELKNTATKPTEEDAPESSSHSNTDCKYSVFASLRQNEDKGEYLGWSKKVLGDGAMGWSDNLRAKPAF